jgi:hypothetical protein
MKGQLGGSGVVPNFEVSVSFQTVRLTSTDPDAIQRFRQNREAAASRRITISRDEHIDEPVKKAISLGFKSKGIKDAANWADMPDAVFFRNMQKCFGECTPTTTKSTTDLDLLLADVENLTYDYEPRKAGGQWSPYVQKIETIRAAYTIPTSDEEKVVKTAIDKLRHSDPNSKLLKVAVSISWFIDPYEFIVFNQYKSSGSHL